MRSKDIKHIHFEPTQRCQAACPMCDRTNNPYIKNAEISADGKTVTFQKPFMAYMKNPDELDVKIVLEEK